MRYIDTDHLKVEIEKQMEDVERHSDLGEPDDLYYDGRRSILVMLRSFIDSLQQEQQEVEFEKEYAKFSNEPEVDFAFPIDLADYKDFALHFFELPGCIFHKDYRPSENNYPCDKNGNPVVSARKKE